MAYGDGDSVRELRRIGAREVKPHNQHAPGLGRLNDKLGSIAAQYRKRVDKELAKTSRAERDSA